MNWLKRKLGIFVDENGKEWTAHGLSMAHFYQEALTKVQIERDQYKTALESLYFYACTACEDNMACRDEALKKWRAK